MMHIGELSERSGISIRSIRYYEQKGLLSPERGINGYRNYTEGDLVRAGLIRTYLSLGLPVKEITALLACEFNRSDKPLCPAAFLIVQQHLHQLDVKIKMLMHARDILRRKMDSYKEGSHPDDY